MNTTISGVRPEDRWLRRHEDDEAVRSTTPSSPPRSISASERALPELTASRSSIPVAPLTPTAQPNARDVQTQRGLDAFRMSLTGWYHTPSGDVAAATPFMMNPGYAPQVAFRADPAKQAAMRKVSAQAGLSNAALARVECGRGTPEEIHRLTQALIDSEPAGKTWTSLDVRRLMFEHAIGLDCAGYTQQAYLSATGRTAAQAGLDAVTNESLSGLSHRGFQRVEAIADVRPGDLIVFDPPAEAPREPGHRAIVYDQRVATADDMKTLLSSREGQAFAVGGRVRVLEMDSSYGCGGDFKEGGVQRQTWLYNESTGRWAQETLSGPRSSVVTAATLYWHPLEGIYRKKGD
jgi:hypothetical protein